MEQLLQGCDSSLVPVQDLHSALDAQANSFTTGDAINSPALTGFSTTGALMGGMEVTWFFAGGGSSFASWGDLGGGLWGVSSGGFAVTFGGTDDTFSDLWTVTNDSQFGIAAVRFSGAPGRTLFDCGWDGLVCGNTGTGPDAGTAGSASGLSLQSAGGTHGGAISGEYTNLVSVTPNPAVGDLFEQLTINFDNILGVGDTYLFLADTDNSDFDAPPPNRVPEPATYALLLAGLGVLGVRARRRHRR